MEDTDYLIWSFEHDGWWGPGEWGYVKHQAEAGRYTLAAVTPPTANFWAPSRNWRRLIPPCTYPWNRCKSSCGKSEAFFRSMRASLFG
jgi:hypothetical protein